MATATCFIFLFVYKRGLLGRTGGQLLVEKDVVSTFLTFHLLKLSCCTQTQVEGWLDSTVAAGADKANNKQIGKRSGHYRITEFLVILMFFCRRWEV